MFDNITSLSFDCYGTLINWEAGIAAALRPWARRQDVLLSDDEIVSLFARHESTVQQERPFRVYPEVLAETMRRVAEDLERPLTEVEAYAFGRSVGTWPVFTDVTNSLRNLARQCELSIVSNVDTVSFRQSNDLIAVEFDHIITAEDVGAYKPNARVFDALLTHLQERGIGLDQHLHVAQSLFHDHVPAKAAGFTTVWINRRHGLPGYGATPPADSVSPDVEFASLADFVAAMR